MPLPNAGRNPISRFGEPGCTEEVVSVKIEFLVGTPRQHQWIVPGAAAELSQAWDESRARRLEADAVRGRGFVLDS